MPGANRRYLAVLLPAVLAAGIPAQAQNNILNNGGFENGLMCYSDWIWSNTGVAYAGDYRFSLSNDAHSGAYSLEISCSGTDCNKGAVNSDLVPAPPNQSYILSVYAKCPAGAYALAYIPGMADGDVAQWLTCDGKWDLNQIAFQTGPAAGYVTYSFYSYGVSWALFDDVTLTFGDGTAPRHTVLHPGFRDVEVLGQTVNVDGSPFLSLGFYDVGYDDLAEVAATGANTIDGFPNYNAADCFNTGQISYLDLAWESGLAFVPNSSTTAELGVPYVFPPLTQKFAPHLANIAWYLADEPDSSVPWINIPPATFLAESRAVEAQTPLPMMADFQQASYGATSGIAPYNGSVDIWMAEPYGSDFSGVNHAIDIFNSLQLRPIWLAQDDPGASLIVPKAYWAVIAGATGIHYFTWATFKADPPSLAAAEQVFSELKGLKNAIFGQNIDTLVVAPPGIASMSRFDPDVGSVYILAANDSTQNIQGNFQVQGLAAGQQITVLYENRTITATSGQFSDSFAGISRHVYVMNGSVIGGE